MVRLAEYFSEKNNALSPLRSQDTLCSGKPEGRKAFDVMIEENVAPTDWIAFGFGCQDFTRRRVAARLEVAGTPKSVSPFLTISVT